MKYLIVCKSEGILYLLLSKNDDGFAISAYHTKEDIMSTFRGYTEAWRRTYESSMSACLGMMQMNPIAIESPENAEDLKEWIENMTAVHISGRAIGRGYYGVRVKESILEREQFKIWNESMKLAGVIQ